MKKNRSSISKGKTYKEIGEYWDTHEVGEIFNETYPVSFDVQIESEITYYAVAKNLSEKVHTLALRQGVTSDTLINLWIQQKVQEQLAQR